MIQSQYFVVYVCVTVLKFISKQFTHFLLELKPDALTIDFGVSTGFEILIMYTDQQLVNAESVFRNGLLFL
jgi:hypothetical protein